MHLLVPLKKNASFGSSQKKMYLLVVLYGFRGDNIAKQKPLIWYF